MADERPDTAKLLAAIEFASRKHSTQRRKNEEASPYINHPIAVAHLLADTGGVSDLITLLAAVLHDTIEDTETTPTELDDHFGPTVRRLVEEVTDDKTLDKAVRKRLQIEHAPDLSRRAKAIKLADKIANVLDVIESPPPDWPLARRLEYLDWTERVVAGCRGANEALERLYDEVLKNGSATLGTDESERNASQRALDRVPESKASSALSGLTDRELRLTAAVYARHGAARHLRETGRLPDVIGGPWSVIPMRHVIEERGVDPELTEDERLVYEAIIREGRLPGGAVRLLDPKPKGD
jgi:guanosine-3',5'-bis(diphosphate) 3'-pyrophosphohydrolase